MKHEIHITFDTDGCQFEIDIGKLPPAQALNLLTNARAKIGKDIGVRQVLVVYDPAIQDVTVHFSQHIEKNGQVKQEGDFKNLAAVIAVLRQGLDALEFAHWKTRTQAMNHGLMQAAHDAQLTQAVKSKLHLGK